MHMNRVAPLCSSPLNYNVEILSDENNSTNIEQQYKGYG